MKNSIIIPLIFCTVFCLNSFAQSAGWEVVQSNTTENLNSIYFFDYQFGIACGDSGIILSLRSITARNSAGRVRDS